MILLLAFGALSAPAPAERWSGIFKNHDRPDLGSIPSRIAGGVPSFLPGAQGHFRVERAQDSQPAKSTWRTGSAAKSPYSFHPSNPHRMGLLVFSTLVVKGPTSM